jgi:hypothetical protein
MDLSGFRTDTNTLLEYHLNIAGNIVTDERDYLRPWRRRFRDILITKNEEALGFLEKPQAEWSAEKRHENFFQYMRGLPSNSKWMTDYVTRILDTDTILRDIQTELGTTIQSMRTNIHLIMEKYQVTIRTLFELNEKLETNITKIEDLQKRLLALSDLDTESAETSLLNEAIYSYLEECYKKWGIQHDYELFCKTFAEFTAYRSVLLPLQASADTHGSPVCSICTTERVTMALTPCGHVFCNSCGQKQRTQCYICRCTVSGRLRIYFS